MFHAVTGCDAVSFFTGKGKISVMDTWSVYTDFTEAFSALLANPTVPPDEELAIIEQYFVYLYDRSSETSMVNVARLNLFCRKGRAIESIPPTRGALIQHILRSIYQASCWEQMFEKSQKLLDPALFGWECVKGRWAPPWTLLPKVSESSSLLVECGCKKGCKGNCKCKKAILECIALCNCSGTCN